MNLKQRAMFIVELSHHLTVRYREIFNRADLQPELRYDQLVQTLGGHGELVRAPGQLQPAFERALASGRPALINVVTDPEVAYPRRSNLA